MDEVDCEDAAGLGYKRTPQALAIRNCFQVGPLRRGAGSIARDQGQIRSHVDLEVIVDQLWGACYHRLLLPVPDQPLTAAIAAALVRNLMAGARSRKGGTTSGDRAGIADDTP